MVFSLVCSTLARIAGGNKAPDKLYRSLWELGLPAWGKGETETRQKIFIQIGIGSISMNEYKFMINLIF